MIEILNASELVRAKASGALVGGILRSLEQRATVGTNLLEIDAWAQQMIADAGGVSPYVDYAPSFGRGPFGHYICTSVNDAVLHGLPRDYVLADGDLSRSTSPCRCDGIVADSALSFVVGEARTPESLALIEATERALEAGIAAGRSRRTHRRHRARDRNRARRRGLPGQHAVRRARRRLDDAPGPARPEHRRARPRLQAPPRAAARARAVGHDRHRRARDGCRRLDPAQRDGLPHRAQRAHDRDHRRRRRDPDACVRSDHRGTRLSRRRASATAARAIPACCP